MKSLFVLACALLSLPLFLEAQRLSLPLWPSSPADSPATAEHEFDTTKPADQLIAGKRVSRLTNIKDPSLTFYPAPASASKSASAALVFPGGGYRILAYDLEGTEICQWLNSISVACVLVKYRVPFNAHFPEQTADLKDAQQAMRITRAHAAQWHINPERIGVIGFSAGAHLAAVFSNFYDYSDTGLPPAPAAANIRPAFALLIYPAYLRSEANPRAVDPAIQPKPACPPTFLVQTEDDPVHSENALAYFQALKELNVPAELHLFPKGGHGYGLRPTALPVTHWPSLAQAWLQSMGLLDVPVSVP